MKRASVVASVILAVAVLLAAYAVGRLIRQARLDIPEPPSQPVVEPNDFTEPNALTAGRRIHQKREETTPEELARIKEERVEKLAEMSNLTDEQQQQFRDEVARKFRSQRRGPGQVPRLSPDDLKAIKQRVANLSDEEKAAIRARMQAPRPASATEPNAPDPNTTTED